MAEVENRLLHVVLCLLNELGGTHPPPDKQINVNFFLKETTFRTRDFKVRKWTHRENRFGRHRGIPAGTRKTPAFMESSRVLGAATALIREKKCKTLVRLNRWVGSSVSDMGTHEICPQCLSSEARTCGLVHAKQASYHKTTTSVYSRGS